MFVSNKSNTFHFNFDNIISWRTTGREVRVRTAAATHDLALEGVSIEEFTEMFEEYRRLTAPPPKTVSWIATAKTESGDEYGPFTFDKKPTDDELQAFFRDLYPCEFDDDDAEGDGPGDWGSTLFVTLHEVE